MKKENGTITLFICTICLFIMAILLSVNIRVMDIKIEQKKQIEEISKQYKVNEDDLESEYQESIRKMNIQQ